MDEAFVVHARDRDGRPRLAEPPGPPLDEVVTDQEHLFVVHHYDPPTVESASIRSVQVHGLVDRTMDLDLASLASAYQLTKVRAVIDCAGTARKFLEPPAPGAQLGNGTCGVADWTGIRLGDVLEAARFDRARATTVVVEGGDWSFQKGLPIEKALHPETLLAVSINGRPLAHEHGAPLRLIVPGWYGVWWVKWVRRIEVTDRPFTGYWQQDRYVLEWSTGETAIVAEQAVRSLISADVGSTSHRIGDVVSIHGWAWSGGGAIDRVEIQVDEADWIPAELDAPSAHWDCTRWHSAVTLKRAGDVQVRSRAFDTRGASQPLVPRRNRLGYANNHVQSTSITVEPGST